jgi:hypothetical protein
MVRAGQTEFQTLLEEVRHCAYDARRYEHWALNSLAVDRDLRARSGALLEASRTLLRQVAADLSLPEDMTPGGAYAGRG